MANGSLMTGMVSILVMMELAHEVDRSFIEFGKRNSFNPCYDGIGSRRNHSDHNRRMLQVSILVMMELAHEAELCTGVNL